MGQSPSDPTGQFIMSSSKRERWWPIVCALALIVASEYKFRIRANSEAVSGSADPFILLEIGVYLAVAVFLFVRFRPSVRFHRADVVTYLLYAYVIILVGSSLYSPYHALALVRAAQVIVALALVCSIARHAGLDSLHRIAHGFGVLAAISVIFGVLAPFPRLKTQPGRFTWLYIHPVQAGEILAIAVVLLAGYLITRGLSRTGPQWPLPIYLVLFLVCAGGLLATKTRGAVIGAVVGIFILLWMRWRGHRKIEFCIVGSAVLTVIALTSSSAIESFFARGESAAQLSTLSYRTTLWSYALDFAGEHPLYGFGLTASRGIFLDSTGLGGGHNAVINLLVDTGLLGVLTWLALLATIIFTALKLPKTQADVGAVRILVVALLSGMVANSVFTQGLGAPATVSCTWLFILATWIALAKNRENTRRPEAALSTNDRVSTTNVSSSTVPTDRS